MNRPTLETIASYGIPTSSYVKAIQHINSQTTLSNDEYIRRIEEMSGFSINDDQLNPRFTYLYIIQETIRSFGELDENEILRVAINKSIEYVNINPWSLAKENKRPVDVNGNPKPKKGVKKEAALKLWKSVTDKTSMTRKEWIAKLVEVVGLTPAGASTYYANLKAGRYA